MAEEVYYCLACLPTLPTGHCQLILAMLACCKKKKPRSIITTVFFASLLELKIMCADVQFATVHFFSIFTVINENNKN